MGNKNSQKKIQTNNKWTNAHYDRINIAVPKGQKEIIRAYATERGESVNAFISRAIGAAMAQKGTDSTPLQVETELATKSEGGLLPLLPLELAEVVKSGMKATGETETEFLIRAAETALDRDAISLRVGGNPAEEWKEEKERRERRKESLSGG